MSINIDEYGKQFYEDYKNGDFEVTLTKYRKKFICEILKKYDTRNMLEIGCGMEPMNLVYDNYDRYTVIEPAKILYESAVELCEGNNRVTIINDFVENLSDVLVKQRFDFIMCVGLIHEVDNPELLIETINKISSERTTVLFTTNNPESFHILLGLEMGVIKDICSVSDKAKTFQRGRLWSRTQVEGLLKRYGFSVLDTGSYFIKPFTHSQMKKMMEAEILNSSMLDGLYKMVKYMPNVGAENYWIVKKNEGIN